MRQSVREVIEQRLERAQRDLDREIGMVASFTHELEQHQTIVEQLEGLIEDLKGALEHD